MKKSLKKSIIFLILIAFVLVGSLIQANGEQTPPALFQTEPTGISGGAANYKQLKTMVPQIFTIGPSLSQQPFPLSPGIGTTFEGFNFDDNAAENGGFLFIPPDSSGAAGPDRVIAVVNVMIEARDKTGAPLWRDALKDFFSPPLGTSTFDPKVIYDHYEDRFVVVTLEQTDQGDGDPSDESRILLAVSKTNAPASATAADWYYLAIDSKTNIGGTQTWADYPGFEADEEAVYVTANMFAFSGGGGAFQGNRLWIVDKGGFYAGGAASVTVHDPIPTGFLALTQMPAQVFGPGGVGPGIGTFLVGYSSLTDGGPGADEYVQVIRIDDPLGSPTFTGEFVTIGDIENVGGVFGFPDLPDAPQSGTATLIEVNDRRALDAVWRDNKLWLTTTIEPNSGSDAGQTTAHWIKLDPSTFPGTSTTDQGNIGGEDIAVGTYTFFPSVAVNSQGDAKFGFAASASSIFAGAYVAGRESGDAPGTVQSSMTVHPGEGPYVRTFGGPRNRWGDYSGISLDPTDDNIFWVFNQYAETQGTPTDPGPEDGRWGTAWASCTFENGDGSPFEHFLSYKIKKTKFDTIGPIKITDQFGARDYNVKRPFALYNPVEKNREGFEDLDTHLMAYILGPVRFSCAEGSPRNQFLACQTEEECGGVTGQTKFCKRPSPREIHNNLLIVNQFGKMFLSTTRADLLLVPSSKRRGDPPDQLDPLDIDHFKCYRIKPFRKGTCEGNPSKTCRSANDCNGFGPCIPAFTKKTVHLIDQFQEPKVYDVLRPTRLCAPAQKKDEPLIDPNGVEGTHLMCYKVRRARKFCNNFPPEQPKSCKNEKQCGGVIRETNFCEVQQIKHEKTEFFVNNQFGPDQKYVTLVEDDLCVLSTKIPIGFNGLK